MMPDSIAQDQSSEKAPGSVRWHPAVEERVARCLYDLYIEDEMSLHFAASSPDRALWYVHAQTVLNAIFNGSDAKESRP